jgi:hypothetical protein
MNDGAACVGFLLVGLVVVIFIATVQIQNANELRATYHRLAHQYRGSCHHPKLFDHPSARFPYHNANALVDIQLTNGEHSAYFTRVHINWPDRAFRMEVYPESFVHRIGKLVGMADIQIGSPKFDDAYVITGNDIPSIESFLNGQVQLGIDRLRQLSAREGVYLSVNGGRLMIKKPGLIRDFKTLSRFVSLALNVFDHATQASVVGIEFVDQPAGSSQAMEEVVCQICGEDIKLDAVTCRSCKTPHHKDCWDYYGACSTYGCGQKRHTPHR